MVVGRLWVWGWWGAGMARAAQRCSGGAVNRADDQNEPSECRGAAACAAARASACVKGRRVLTPRRARIGHRATVRFTSPLRAPVLRHARCAVPRLAVHSSHSVRRPAPIPHPSTTTSPQPPHRPPPPTFVRFASHTFSLPPTSPRPLPPPSPWRAAAACGSFGGTRAACCAGCSAWRR